MRKLKIFFTITFSVIVFALFKGEATASDGTAELRSTAGEDSRCYAASLLMQDWFYTVLVSCRDLIYPGEFGLVNYVLWTQPTDGSNPVNLGILGYGKATFRTNKPFNNLFVTIEGQVGQNPTGRVVMRGTVTPITFLDRPSPATPTPTGTQEGGESGQTEQEQSTEQLSTRDRLFLALRRAGIAALIALVALVGLIFVVTRARG